MKASRACRRELGSRQREVSGLCNTVLPELPFLPTSADPGLTGLHGITALPKKRQKSSRYSKPQSTGLRKAAKGKRTLQHSHVSSGCPLTHPENSSPALLSLSSSSSCKRVGEHGTPKVSCLSFPPLTKQVLLVRTSTWWHVPSHACKPQLAAVCLPHCLVLTSVDDIRDMLVSATGMGNSRPLSASWVASIRVT